MKTLGFALLLACACSASPDDVDQIEQAAACSLGDCVQIYTTLQTSSCHENIPIGSHQYLETIWNPTGLGPVAGTWPVCVFLGNVWPEGDHYRFGSINKCNAFGFQWTQTWDFPIKRGRSLYGTVTAKRTGVASPSCTESWLVQSWL